MKNKHSSATAKAKTKPIELQAKNAAPPKLPVRKGPEPERLKIEGNWTKAVDKALTVKRPPGGWPK